MFFDYEWIQSYFEGGPSQSEAVAILNATGLESERSGVGLEIEHTVNRSDAMSHFGVARELAVKVGARLIPPPGYTGELPHLSGWRIESDDAKLCPRYMGVLVENLVAGPSPAWLKTRLDRIGQTSHNLLVDLTNFLLWEYGHPSHAFDADRLAGQRIQVRMGRTGEKLTTLDGREHETAGFLCIADDERAVAFAGVMGGANSEIHAGTTRMLFELAVFDTVTVRRTGRAKNIDSDARHRFERGVDWENMEHVVRRFLGLLLTEQPQARIVGLYDMNLAPRTRTKLLLRRSRLDLVLGVFLADELVDCLLQRMDFRPKACDAGWEVEVPGYKVDVTREIDLIEELIRFAGFDLLNTDMPAMGGTNYRFHPFRDRERTMQRLLRGFGFQETCTYGFIPESWDKAFQQVGAPIRLRNPMTENQAVMRRMLLPSILDCVVKNVNRGIQDLAFFEIANSFQSHGEPHHLAAVIAVGKLRKSWWEAPDAHPYYRIKGTLESLIETMGWRSLSLRRPAPFYLDPAESLGIYQGDHLLGGFGSLAKELQKSWDLEFSHGVLELDLSFLAEERLPIPAVSTLSLFPAIQVDLAFVVSSRLEYGEIHRHILDLGLERLESLDLFDTYEGKSVGEGNKSLGFRFRFRAADRTLTSEEVAGWTDRVVESVRQTFAASLRV